MTHYTANEIKLPRLENGPFKDAVFEVIKPYIQAALNPIMFEKFYNDFGFDLSNIANMVIEDWCNKNKFSRAAYRNFIKSVRGTFGLVCSKQIEAEDLICKEVGKVMAIKYITRKEK